MMNTDVNETKAIDNFIREGCDCIRGAKVTPCYTLFTREYYENMRSQCQELDRNTLDMVIMGYLLGSMSDSQHTNRECSHRAPKQRERQRFKYYHKGLKVKHYQCDECNCYTNRCVLKHSVSYIQ